MCHMDEKKSLLEFKKVVSWNNFPVSPRVNVFDSCALWIYVRLMIWNWGPDSASLMGMQFLGKIYWGQRQPWGQTGASFVTLISVCVCLWVCAWYWEERQCHFGVNFLLRTPESWGNTHTYYCTYIVTICHFTYRSFNFDLLSCTIMGFSLNLVINSAL